MTARRLQAAAVLLALVALLGGCCCTCPGVSTNALLLFADTPASAEAAAWRTIANESL